MAADTRFRRAGGRRKLWRSAVSLALAAGMVVQSAGCTRSFYRKQADKEVSEVIAQKDKYPDWAIENWHIYADPRARFADPSDPDRPPKPPDDPAAYALSPNPQKPPCKGGVQRIEGTGYLELIAQWDRENRQREAEEAAREKAENVEPPVPPEEEEDTVQGPSLHEDPEGGPATPAVQQVAFQQPAPADQPPDISARVIPTQRDALEEAKSRSLLDITGRPTFLLTLDQSAELAMFNSREYQDARETVYLAALPVTQERFSFMAQFFAASEAVRAEAGSESVLGKTNNWSLNNGVGFAKILPTGALLLLNFSNTTVFDFLSPKKTLSTTNLNFDAIQPLLQGGGKAVALESLTQAERNLLYAIRNYARFRKELYAEIASNNGGAINGSAFQPVGVLSSGNGIAVNTLGPSGLNPGVPPVVSTIRNGVLVAPNSPGALTLAPAITPPPSGYLNTMLQNITIFIDKENIDVLGTILLRYRGLLEGDVVGPLQVQSVEQQLLAGRSTLLADQQNYLQSVDAFKIELGVPESLNIETDDSVLRPLIKQFGRARAITDDEQAAVTEASDLIKIEKAPQVRTELLRLLTRSKLVHGTAFASSIRARWAFWEKLNDQQLKAHLDALSQTRKDLLEKQADLQHKDQALSPEDTARLRELSAQIDLGYLEQAVRVYEANYVENGRPKEPADAIGKRLRVQRFQAVLGYWQMVLVEARDDRWAAVRATWPQLPRVCVDGVDLIQADLSVSNRTATQHALENRLDLMNNRAQLVDSWRQLAIYANALLGVFNVQYHLDASTPPNSAQPLNIGGSATAHELILNGELPLVRIQERNNYRASVIAYQRQRRTLEEAEDLAAQVVRVELTNLRQFAEQYKIQQRQLELAYLTIDSSLESLLAPTPPGPVRAGADGPAALTSQLLSAQRSLPAAQNALNTIWINYLDERLQLYRDLELMPLDARGVWIDEVRDCDCGIVAPEKTEAPTPTQPEQIPAPKPQQAPPKQLPPAVEQGAR